MTYVLATIFTCVVGGGCQTTEIHVEPRACAIRSIRAEVPVNGEWKVGTITIRCKR